MEMKTPLPQRPIKELIVEVVKIEIPAAPALAKTKESRTPKTTSSKPSLRKGGRKKTKELSPESEEEEAQSLEEEEVECSSETVFIKLGHFRVSNINLV